MGITQNTGASSLIRPGVIDNTAARPASPFEGQMVYQKDTDETLVWSGTAWVLPNKTQVAIFQEQKANGSNVGNASTGAWTKRTLDTTVTNGITGCSISSSVISLPAGSYTIQSEAPFYNTGMTTTRLRDTTNGVTLVTGTACLADDRYQTQVNLLLRGYFTLTGTTNIELQYYASSNYNANSLGVAMTNGSTEIYANIMIQKVP
jgi:hypothetical protein